MSYNTKLTESAINNVIYFLGDFLLGSTTVGIGLFQKQCFTFAYRS